MSIDIQTPNATFDFSKLALGDPIPISNGFYFSSIKHSNDLYIQTPEIYSKSGFVKSSNKHYIDLLFQQDHEEILEWFENLENRIKHLIYEKKNDWFSESNIEMSDIENIFISPMRAYKSGKQFIVRCNVESVRNALVNKRALKIYDENQNEISMASVQNDTRFIGLLHLSGIKFSPRTFQIYIEIKQMMTISESSNCFTNCLIKKEDKVIDKITLEGSETQSREITGSPIEDENCEKTEEHTEPILAEEGDKNESRDEQQEIQVSEEKEIEEEEEEEKETGETLDNSAVIETLGVSIADETVSSTLEKIVDEAVSAESHKADDIEISNKVNESAQNESTQNESTQNESTQNESTPIETINEIDFNNLNLETSDITIKEPEEEHIELYRAAMKKAKDLRKQALQSHLEAENIKAKYLLNVYSDSDSDYSEQELEENE